jgi:cobalt-zinc-cadmium efflux system outer membrane protein
MLRCLCKALALALFAVASPSVVFARDEGSVAVVDQSAVVREALRVQAVHVRADLRAGAEELEAKAASILPPPELMAQIWQVPFRAPLSLGEAGMVMLGVSQSFVAPGSSAAREKAGAAMASVERMLGKDRVRVVKRDAGHAFANYVEASSRHAIHREHRELAVRVLSLARARHAGGATLTDVVQAEVELARVDADVAGDGVRVTGAAQRVNLLLGLDEAAPLGPPRVDAPATVAWETRESLAEARRARPQVQALRAERNARLEQARAAGIEASVPAFRVAALYFAPVGPMPAHGFGADVSMSMPWLSGDARARRDASRKRADATQAELREANVSIDADVIAADVDVRASALRLQVLRDKALPAARRAFDATWAGYESGRADVVSVIAARRALVDVASDMVSARASLDHALVELDASVGVDIPRRPLAATNIVEPGAQEHHDVR